MLCAGVRVQCASVVYTALMKHVYTYMAIGYPNYIYNICMFVCRITNGMTHVWGHLSVLNNYHW